MTGLTSIGRADMRRGLTTGRAAIVTTDTIASDGRMIHRGTDPLRGGEMTHITLLYGRHMGGAHARGYHTIMAT